MNRRPNRSGRGGGVGVILTPGRTKLEITAIEQDNAFPASAICQIPSGPSTVTQLVSFGMTKLEYAASLIAGQIAGEFAWGMKRFTEKHKDAEFGDDDYVSGVACLAVDMAGAILAECQERMSPKTEDKSKCDKVDESKKEPPIITSGSGD